jgi:hypothetical protein
MGSVEVLVGLRPEEFRRWEDLCQNIPHADVYFLPQYAQIYERKGDGTAHCFVYCSADGMVLYPFLLRRVNDLALFHDVEECWDITTPYGYGGPLYSSIDEASLPQLVRGFLENFHTYCREQRIVSEFARLHPLLDNHRILPRPNKVLHHETVWMDLEQSDEQLWKGLRQNHRRNIRKAITAGVDILLNMEFTYLKEFYSLYIETMRRNQAAPYYFFPYSFFEDTVGLLGEHVSLFVALHDGKIISASLFTVYGDFIQYHFSGTNAIGLHLGAFPLLVYEAAKWAREQGAKFFHLGGGLQQDDSLFMFKSGFSNKRAPFYTYRRIHDSVFYQQLVQKKLEDERLSRAEVDKEFFPRYRA